MNRMMFSYIGNVMPSNILNKFFEDVKKVIDIPASTFFSNILEGIAENGCYVEAFPVMPQFVIDKNSEFIGNVHYLQQAYQQKRLSRFIDSIVSAFKQVKKFKKKCEDRGTEGFLIFNVLKVGSALGGLVGAKCFHINTIAVVTDVPGHRIKNTNRSIINYLSNFIGKLILNRFDSYVLLSEQMKEVIKTNGRPVSIIEGLIGDEFSKHDWCSSRKDATKEKFELIYAGSLEYRYGVMNLVRAVLNIDYKDVVLSVFGSGEAADEISGISEFEPRITYRGMIPRDELIINERNASLLVNPRPINDEYVKYSFPSKVMEYMASGTTTLLTDIPSLLKEYKEHVVLAKDNSVDSLKRTIETCYEHRHSEEFLKIGKDARSFIINHKNRRIQTQKILSMANLLRKQGSTQ